MKRAEPEEKVHSCDKKNYSSNAKPNRKAPENAGVFSWRKSLHFACLRCVREMTTLKLFPTNLD